MAGTFMKGIKITVSVLRIIKGLLDVGIAAIILIFCLIFVFGA